MLHYDPDTGVFTWRSKPNRRVKIGTVAGWSNLGYVTITVDTKYYQAHRLAWMYVYGVDPGDMLVDHNGDRSDNRLSNLVCLLTARMDGMNRTVALPK